MQNKAETLTFDVADLAPAGFACTWNLGTNYVLNPILEFSYSNIDSRDVPMNTGFRWEHCYNWSYDTIAPAIPLLFEEQKSGWGS